MSASKSPAELKKKISNIFLDPGSQVAKLSNLDLSEPSVFRHAREYINNSDIVRPHIKLDRTRMSSEQLTDMLMAIQANVLSLSLAGNALGNSGASTVAQFVGEWPHLQILDLRDNSIGADGVVSVFGACSEHPSLISIDLSNNVITDTIRARFLQIPPNLQTLRLGYNKLKQDVARLSFTDCQLEELDIRLNNIRPEGMLSLAPKLAQLRNLRILCVAGNNIQGIGVQHLMDGLAGAHALEELDVSNNNITDLGVEYLNAKISTVPSLHTLNVCNNHITDVGGTLLVEILAMTPKLRTLVHSPNDMSRDSAAAVEAAISQERIEPIYDASPVQRKSKPQRGTDFVFDLPPEMQHHPAKSPPLPTAPRQPRTITSPFDTFATEMELTLPRSTTPTKPARPPTLSPTMSSTSHSDNTSNGGTSNWEARGGTPEETKDPQRTRTNIYKQLFDLFMDDSDTVRVFDVIGDDSDELGRVAEQLKSLPHTKESLVLDGCHVTSEGILEILQANKDVHSTIKSISLRRTGVTDEILRSICGFLQDDQLISELILAESSLNGDAIPILQSIFQYEATTVLRSINLDHNPPVFETDQAITGVEQLVSGPIQSLSLAHCDLMPVVLLKLATGLPRGQLQTLSLRGNNVGTHGARLLASGLQKARLKSLDIAQTNLGDDGVRYIITALKQSDTMTDLWLSCNEITDVGGVAVAEYIKASNSLDRLWLDENDLGDETGVAILGALDSANIRSISLLNTRCSAEVQTRITRALEYVDDDGWGMTP